MEALSEVLLGNHKQDGGTLVHRFMQKQLEPDIFAERDESPPGSLMVESSLLAEDIRALLEQNYRNRQEGR